MKKWLVSILLFIIAAATVVPCFSIDDCCADQVASTHNHDKHTSEGVCSPFFACATCPVSMELAKSIEIDFPAVEDTVQHLAIVNFNLTTYSSSFWQPPRSC